MYVFCEKDTHRERLSYPYLMYVHERDKRWLGAVGSFFTPPGVLGLILFGVQPSLSLVDNFWECLTISMRVDS